jgi:hypothetical protein
MLPFTVGFRKALPATTAWMEWLVTWMQYRVMGTRMFWKDLERAETLLPARATSMCDREDQHLDPTRQPCGRTRTVSVPLAQRASVGSIEAAEDVVARVGRIDRSKLGSIAFGVVGPMRATVAACFSRFILDCEISNQPRHVAYVACLGSSRITPF